MPTPGGREVGWRRVFTLSKAIDERPREEEQGGKKECVAERMRRQEMRPDRHADQSHASHHFRASEMLDGENTRSGSPKKAEDETVHKLPPSGAHALWPDACRESQNRKQRPTIPISKRYWQT